MPLVPGESLGVHPAQARPLALLRSGATLRQVQALVPRRDSYEPQSSHWRLQSRSRLPQRPPLVQRPQNPPRAQVLRADQLLLRPVTPQPSRLMHSWHVPSRS